VKNLICDEIKVKFFVPGRIRLYIALLYKNKFLTAKILNSIKNKTNINSIHIDSNTCNLIIIYNYEKLSEIDLKRFIEIEIKPFLNTGFNKLSLTAKSEENSVNKSIYENEKAISKRIFLGSLFVIGTISIASFNIATIISTMILASPFILFYLRNKGYRLTSDLLSKGKVDLKNHSLIKFFSEVDEIYIQDDLIIDKGIVNKNIDFLQNNSYSLERLVIYGEVEEPIFPFAKILIKNLRNIGVNKIFIISKQTNEFISYANGVLGINSLTLKECYMTKCINSFSEESTIIVLGRSNFINGTNHSLVIYLNPEKYEVKNKEENSFLLSKREILKLPYSILLCKYMENTINTTENICLTINMIGLIFAISKYIFIRGSIMIYLLNFVISRILLNMGLKKNDLTVLESLK